MAHVKVKYVEETFYDDEELGGCSYPEWKLLEGDYKKVKWDGESLTVGHTKIITQSLSTYGINDIQYLEIDGDVYVDNRPETLRKQEEEREKRWKEILEDRKENE